VPAQHASLLGHRLTSSEEQPPQKKTHISFRTHVPDRRHVKRVQQTNTSLTHPNRETRQTSRTLPSWETCHTLLRTRCCTCCTHICTQFLFLFICTLTNQETNINWRSQWALPLGTTPLTALIDVRFVLIVAQTPAVEVSLTARVRSLFFYLFAHKQRNNYITGAPTRSSHWRELPLGDTPHIVLIFVQFVLIFAHFPTVEFFPFFPRMRPRFTRDRLHKLVYTTNLKVLLSFHTPGYARSRHTASPGSAPSISLLACHPLRGIA